VRACDSEELARGAVDCFVTGRTFIHFCKSPNLWGIVIWGRPGKDDLAPLVRSLELELHAPAVPHGSIVDASRLSGIDSSAFELLDAYVRNHFDELGRAVTKLALIRPSGVEGAVVAGFFEVLPKPYAVSVFETLEAALDWLGSETRFAAELSEIYANVASASPLVTALGAFLEMNLVSPSVATAAKALGLSERTLQRRLQDSGTNFQDEVQNARMRVAERLLLDTDSPLTAIAFDVGYASLQRFSAMFRSVTGESPSAWRARRRAGG